MKTILPVFVFYYWLRTEIGSVMNGMKWGKYYALHKTWDLSYNKYGVLHIWEKLQMIFHQGS